MIIFIIPKNSGLKICKETAEAMKTNNSVILQVRGEDVALFVDKLLKKQECIGITGEDLFNEYKLRNKESKLEIIKKIVWNDDSAIFKKPALCLLGPRDKELKQIKNPVIGVNKKYSETAKRFLDESGIKGKLIYFSGSTELAFEAKICNLIIEIVYSGESIKKSELKIYKKISESDVVVIKNKLEKEEEFNLNRLYDIILIRAESENPNSYTKKLINDISLLRRKIIEEAGELITAGNKEEVIWEASDLLYFLFVYLAVNNITIEDINKENQRRNKETLLNKESLTKERSV